MCTLKLIESNNDKIKYIITDEKELRELLNNLVKQVNRVVILEITNIGIFTLGIGLPLGFIQYSKSGDSPYLIASGTGNDELIGMDDEEGFDANGTPTQIPKRFCIPYARIVNIIIHFYKNHELPQFERWVEI